jgi:cation transport regulator
MPFDTSGDLPENVTKVLPKHAQEIYRAAFNSAWEEYKDPADRRDNSSREETAHKVAWAAVKKNTKKMAISGEKNKWGTPSVFFIPLPGSFLSIAVGTHTYPRAAGR